MIITPNTRGHYPKGYPRGQMSGVSGEQMSELEQATDKPDLTIFKSAIESALSDASGYLSRCEDARDWWYARWPGQTVDGRKHESEYPINWGTRTVLGKITGGRFRTWSVFLSALRSMYKLFRSYENSRTKSLFKTLRFNQRVRLSPKFWR